MVRAKVHEATYRDESVCRGAFLLSMECIGNITTNFIVTYMPSTWL